MDIAEICERFPTQDACRAYLEKLRRGIRPRAVCPWCQVFRTSPVGNRHHCNSCNRSFSVTLGTMFHDTKVPLQKRFIAIAIILNAKKGVSALQMSRDVGVDKDTAWSMCMRIRKVMRTDMRKVSGWVQMDETFVGGRKRKWKPLVPKVPVIGAISNSGYRVAAEVSPDTTYDSLTAVMRKHIDIDHTPLLMTDDYSGYKGVDFFSSHETINHSQGKYMRAGYIHTNTIEGFWSILKRSLYGQHHRVTARHLQAYVDETCYKYNNRTVTNAFEMFLYRAVGQECYAVIHAKYKE